jgi:type I restriction enzyme S subunit
MDALDTELPWPKYYGKRDTSEYSGKTFTKGDTLFARITPCTENGKAAFVPEMETKVGIGSTEYAVLSPKTDRINPWLLYYFSKSYPVHNYAVSRMRGSTGRQRVPFSVFRRELDVALPPLTEQNKTSTIIYTIDQYIQKTEDIINHIKNLRKATIDELFTSGYERHSKQQIDYIGPRKVEYPSGWDIVELGNLTKKITKGKTPTSYGYNYTDSGINFIKVESILESGKFDISEFDHIGEEAHNHLSGSELIAGDILFSIAGALGKVAQINESILPANTNQALALIRTDDPRVLPEYIRYYLETNIIQKYIQSIATTTAQSNLNLKQISEFSILLPSIQEQKKIIQVVQDLNARLENERSRKKHLKRLKRGLMQDLLSGTVRTTDTNIQVPDEIAQYG